MKTRSFFSIAFLALALCACTKEELVQTRTVSIVAEMGDTKTALAEGGKAVWNAGDAIDVFSNGKAYKFTTSDSGSKATFTGQIPADASAIYAVYPSDPDNKISGSTLSVSLDPVQLCPAGSFAPGQAVTVAKGNVASDGGSLTFHNLCGIVQVEIASSDVRRVILTATNSKAALSGSVDLNADDMTFSPSAQNASVTLAPASGEVFTPGTYSMLVLPGDVSGFQLAYCTSTVARTRTTAKTLSIKRSAITKISGNGTGDGWVESNLFFKGSGSEADPFQISTSTDLVNLSAACASADSYTTFADKHYLVTADIDMSGVSFSPICSSSSSPFKGVIDGGSHSISNLQIHSTATAAVGLVAYANGATVRNINFKDADVDSEYAYCGAVVGFATEGTTVEGCTVSGQVRNYKSNISVAKDEYNVVATSNAGYSGSIVGLAVRSTVKDCRLEGKATFYGKFSGGIVGMSYNSSIIGCSVAKECPVNVYYHFGGGIVGRAMGADNIIKGCSFEGNYTTVGYAAGGIVGQLLGGKVQECVLGSYADFGGDKFFVGGIAGSAQPVADITVDHCASYGRVHGSYCVSGIVGYAGQGSGASSDKDLILTSLTAGHQVTISSCAAIGNTVTATGGNSSGYSIAAGILGWSHTNVKLLLDGCYSAPALIQTTYGSNKYGVLSGICSYQNSTSGATIRNCYSSVSPEQMLICGDKASNDETNWYAGIHIRCTQATTVTSCYTQEGMRVSYSSSAATETDCNTFTVAQMTDGTLLNALKASADGTEWVAGTNGYPTIQGIPADPNVKKKASKRVSVIGDSISTFKGWVPGGYSCHYPTTDGALTLVNETYWYRLIHDFMKDAEFDTNIAYSGSTVTNTTTANYQARYGSASNSWWHNSFTERFAACGGMGTPDIILIHGGTNDWAHNADPLAPDVAIRNDESNIYGGSAPSADVMNAIYATADAASTRTAVNALPDGTFCEAYVKLMCQIRERYPKCKVVCIIGDYLSQSIEQSIIQIAAHYGAKTVNLFRVNGFNDLGGYTPETLKLGEAQPNMPKHDHTDLSVATGCHPGSQAMLFMANKIYTELGAWLEE